MHITRRRLTGFKSFVDPADLRIEPGLTGVVGPNGCGKSNLLEALRWVMGETSAKSMRGSGMDDVIFAGTATRPPRDFAEVSILAEDVTDVGTGVGEELEIVRRIDRGAGSAYRINGRDARAKDVALAFADAATGAHSPALVSQGRIGAVIAAKPAERRAMLEESAGIAGLHVRRRDAEAKLRATETNLTRLDEVIGDQLARAAVLKRQARQAERYRALSDAIRIAEARMIFARWRDAAAAADTAKQDAGAAQTLVGERAEEVRTAAADRLAATALLSQVRAASLAARDLASDAGHRLSTLRAERATVERRLTELADQRRRLADDRTREGALANDAARAMERLSAERAALSQRIAAGAARLPELDMALAEAERVGRDAEVALAQALAAQAGEMADARVASAARDAAAARLDHARREATAIDRDLAALADPKALDAERARAASTRVAAIARTQAARAAIDRAAAAEAELLARRDMALSARAAAQAELAAHDSEARALQRPTALDHDRAIDRLSPAPGYERALAAALGDDLEAGLDPAADRYWGGAEAHPSDPAPPPGTARLIDHVDAPAALARRLAQLLVVDTDTGQPLAVGQRLVTRDGVLRRWDGFVARSIGAAAAERLERANRLAELNQQRPALLTAFEEAGAETGGLDAEIDAIRVVAADARRTLDAGDAAAREAARREDRAVAAIERAGSQRDDLVARSARSRAAADDAAQELARAEAALATLPDGTATQARVNNVGAAAAAARSAIAVARAERAATGHAVAQDRERAAAADAESNDWQARAGDAAARIAAMTRRETDLTSENDRLGDRPAMLAAEIAATEAATADTRAAAEAALAEEHAAEARLRAAEAITQTAGEALAEAREARAGAAARADNQDARRIEMGRLSGERFQCPPPLLPVHAGFAADDIGVPAEESARHERLTLDRERIGPVNLIAETELTELDSASANATRERDELAEAVARLRGSIGTLNREGRQRLTAAFDAVDGHFRRLFTTLFDGGQAHLALVDSDDPLEAGLEIMAQPPGKRLQSLTLLSGGEQALTAIALIFALFLTNPAPICVLDEVDAPLDDANIERFCDLLDRMTRETDTRYLIVTHNAATMSRMHRLFGVTMIEQGVSRLVSVDLGGAERLLAAE